MTFRTDLLLFGSLGFCAYLKPNIPTNLTLSVKNGTCIELNDPELNTDNFYGVAYAQPLVQELQSRRILFSVLQHQQRGLCHPGLRQCTGRVNHPKYIALSDRMSSRDCTSLEACAASPDILYGGISGFPRF